MMPPHTREEDQMLYKAAETSEYCSVQTKVSYIWDYVKTTMKNYIVQPGIFFQLNFIYTIKNIS